MHKDWPANFRPCQLNRALTVSAESEGSEGYWNAKPLLLCLLLYRPQFAVRPGLPALSSYLLSCSDPRQLLTELKT